LCGAVPFFFSFFCLLLAERSSEMDMDGCVPHHGGTENVQRYLGQGKAATSDDEPATRLAREGMLDRLALVVVGLGWEKRPQPDLQRQLVAKASLNGVSSEFQGH
jgi:hypothetical protein